MITDYPYIEIDNPSVATWIYMIPLTIFGVSVLITILYLIFARERKPDGLLFRFVVPGVFCLICYLIMGSIVSGISNSQIRSEKTQELEALFDKVDYSEDAFTAETKEGVSIRGALIPSKTPEGKYGKYAVVYVKTKD